MGLMRKENLRFKFAPMKHPFKILGLLIIAAGILYKAWPDDTVRDHNPMTGGGESHEGHDHEHLDPPTLKEIEESIESVPLDRTPVE